MDDEDDLLIRAVASAPARQPPKATTAAPTLTSPAGEYEITGQLGQGGMATVFAGVHRRTRQRVAIKFLRTELSRQRDVVARFFNEAYAVRHIRHPSVVEIFEVAQVPDGVAYIVMEFLDGETLSAHLRRAGRLGVAALPIVREVAAAVAQAHECRIVHRDLKPDNVMLVPTATALRVKVLDFGIAKIAHDAELAPGMGVRTRTGTVLGTPLYMSPEQCRGDGGVGAPTDVYAMGAMLHQLVAGTPPFNASGIGELLLLQVSAPPPPLSHLVPGVDPSLEQLTLSMLEKEPQRRPTMHVVLRALDRLIAGNVPATAAAPTLILSSGPLRDSLRVRASRIVIAGLTASLLGGGVVMTLRARHSSAVSAIAPSSEKPTAVLRSAVQHGPADAPKTIVWLIKSEPAHASVVRSDDGKLLGRTPWYVEQPAATGTLDVVVRKRGYAEQRATLDSAADSTFHLKLAPTHGARIHQEDDLDVQPLR